MNINKKCYLCKIFKPLTDFYKDVSSKDGFGGRCKECNKTYKKEYHKTYCQTEKYKENRKKRYWNNPEKERDKNNARRRSDPEHYKKLSRKSYRKNIVQILWSQSQRRAKKYGYEHNISKEDIVIPEYCPVLGIPLIISDGRSSYNSPTLDRFDNNQGYIKGNVRVISFRANSLKSNASVEELEKIIKYIKNEI